MKLSEAIKKGSENTVKGTGSYLVGYSAGKPMVCALGAAWLAVYGEDQLTECRHDALVDEWPVLAKGHRGPETVGVFTDELWGIVTMLNDSADWSREDIAIWLEKEGF